MNAVLTAALAIALFAPCLFFGEVPIFRDFTNTFLPFKLYAAAAFAAGRVPLWAPEMAFGTPFLANYQSGVLYPPSLIVDLLPNPTGIGLYLAFHFWIAGYGMDRFLERRGLPARARLFGAVTTMLGGVWISIAPWSHLAVASWIPLSMVAAEDLVSAPQAGRFAWLVVLLALELLGGAPESFAQAAAFVAAITVATAIRRRTGATAALRVALAALLAAALAAAQLLPTLEYFVETARREGLPPGIAMDQSLDPRTLLTLLVPHRIEGGTMAPIVEPRLPLFWSIYLGILPLALALIGAVRPALAGCALALGASLLLALGDHTPLYPLLYAVAPRLFGAFRYPQKFLIAAHLCAAILAASGFAWLERRIADRSRRLAVLLGWTLIAATVFDLYGVHQPALLFTDWARLLPSAPAPLLASGGTRFLSYEPHPPGLASWLPTFSREEDLRTQKLTLWSAFAGNAALVYGIGYTNGQDSFTFARPPIAALERTLRSLPLPGCLRLLRALGVSHLVGWQRLDAVGLDAMQAGGDGRAWIYRLRDPAPRIYLARRVRVSPTLDGAYAGMAEAGFIPGEDVVLAAPWEGRPSENLAAGEVRVASRGPESMAVDVDLPADGIVVVQDSYFPGWRARLDGRAVAIVRANGVGRAVGVRAGRHRLEMSYEPASFRLGALTSMGALIGSTLLATILWRRRS